MPLAISVITNCDDALIFWKAKKPLPGCWGFAIERERKEPNGMTTTRFLVNRVGFPSDDAKPGEVRPSTQWPFQRFSWTDHEVNSGDKVRYRVVPMIHDGTALVAANAERSPFSPWAELSGDAGGSTSVFFNRGLVISQFMARYLEQLRMEEGLATQREALVEFKKSLSQHELPIRNFLSGVLRTEMLSLLATAKKQKQHVFGALYELDDDELVAALGALGARGHIVLANGSITKKKTETSEQARKRDQNKAGRAVLKKAKVEVFNRMVSPGALAHNKFLVITDAKEKPVAVWTGSTNFTMTGLCTQINNGLLVRDAKMARVYLDQWQRLRDAKSEFPKSLVAENSKPKTIGAGKGASTVWFSRTSKSVDLDAIENIVSSAKKAVLFLMFQPGGSATFGSIKKLLLSQPADSGLYIKGVVSTLPAESEETEDYVDVSVVGDGARRGIGLDIVQPEGFKTPFASWAATVTRNDFIPTQGGVVGFAIVHSKIIVVDPFTKPIVITGSHNFSKSASTKNDENFVILRDNAELARQYAAHIVTVYQHYRWLTQVRDMQKRKVNPKGTLRETDTWQKSQLSGASLRELNFWVA